jgi:hypothetical protein
MIINSAGFVSSKLIRSQNALNFGHPSFLGLHFLLIPAQKDELPYLWRSCCLAVMGTATVSFLFLSSILTLKWL